MFSNELFSFPEKQRFAFFLHVFRVYFSVLFYLFSMNLCLLHFAHITKILHFFCNRVFWNCGIVSIEEGWMPKRVKVMFLIRFYLERARCNEGILPYCLGFVLDAHWICSCSPYQRAPSYFQIVPKSSPFGFSLWYCYFYSKYNIKKKSHYSLFSQCLRASLLNLTIQLLVLPLSAHFNLTLF